jgi:hypothetical protein
LILKYKITFNYFYHIKPYLNSTKYLSAKYNCKTIYNDTKFGIYFFDINGTFFIDKTLFDKNQIYDFIYDQTETTKIITSYD